MALTRWLLVAPLALLAGGSWYATRHVASAHPSRPAGAASHAGAQALVGGFRIPELGDQDEFELKLSLRIEITPLESGTPTANELSVTGSWATAVVERRAGTVTRRLVLSRLEAGPSNASPASRRDSELARQLSSPLYASYDSEGRIQGVVFPPTAVGPARAILANLLAVTQVVHPVGAQGAWSTLEPDAEAMANLSYRCGFTACEKSKTGYARRSASPAPTDAMLPNVEQSRFRFETDRDGHLVSVVGRESGSLEPVGMLIKAALEVQLHRTSTATMALDPGALPHDLHTVPLWTKAGPVARSVPGPPRALQAAIDRLEQSVSQGSAEQRESALESLLQAFAGDGRLVAQGLAFVRRGGPAAASMLSAILRAGGKEAEHAATELLADPRISPELRQQALRGLALWPGLSDESVRAVRAEMGASDDAWRRQATNVYGASAWNIRGQDPEGAKRIVAELGDGFTHAQAADDRTSYVTALGNTGSPAALDWLEPETTQGSAEQRAAAIRALRLIQTPAAQALIIRALTTDPSSEVRAAALFAIDYQPIGPFLAALATACQHDPDVSIRTGAVRQLARSLATTPATRTLLALVAEHDESPELRALTASLLAPHR